MGDTIIRTLVCRRRGVRATERVRKVTRPLDADARRELWLVSKKASALVRDATFAVDLRPMIASRQISSPQRLARRSWFAHDVVGPNGPGTRRPYAR